MNTLISYRFNPCRADPAPGVDLETLDESETERFDTKNDDGTFKQQKPSESP